jgi:hypothetical protein
MAESAPEDTRDGDDFLTEEITAVIDFADKQENSKIIRFVWQGVRDDR